MAYAGRYGLQRHMHEGRKARDSAVREYVTAVAGTVERGYAGRYGLHRCATTGPEARDAGGMRVCGCGCR